MTRADVHPDLEQFVRDCSDCHKPIVWAKTIASGLKEWMPLDAAPHPDRGNVLLARDPQAPRRLTADVVGNRGNLRRLRFGGYRLYLHHGQSCPYADRWARVKRHERPAPRGVAAAPHLPTREPNTAPEGLF
jgi:hypothetical protein